MENATPKLVLRRQTLRNLTPEASAPSAATRISDATVPATGSDPLV